MDGYTQTKVEAEHLALDAHRLQGLPLVVLRPGFVYGPRDRTVLPRLVERLKNGFVQYLGDGKQAMNTIYVGNLVDAILIALEKAEAVGQIYNLTDGEYVSKRRFFETIADGLGLPKPTKSKPLWVAKLAARFLEWRARRRKATQAPRITRATVKFVGLNLDFSIEKAKRDLGYNPRVGFEEGMKRTFEWHRSAAASNA
jgi:nucleoside-diphosphate-sugar epimerase